MLRALVHLPRRAPNTSFAGRAVLTHENRHLRRKLIVLEGGDEVLVDLAQTVALANGDALALEDGRMIEIIAAPEMLCEIRGRNTEHLTRIAWHLGNRHLPAQIENDRILILSDHVIAKMLTGLGAIVTDIEAPFSPEHGAYHDHGNEPHALNHHG